MAPHCSVALYKEDDGNTWIFSPTLAASTSRAMISTISSRGSPWPPGNWCDALKVVWDAAVPAAARIAAPTTMRYRFFIVLSPEVLIRLLSMRSEDLPSELQSIMRISYAVFCLKKKKNKNNEYNMTYRI